MDFELTEEQAMLRDLSRSMLASHCTTEAVRSLAESRQDLDDKLWRRGTELGWCGLAADEEHGGSGQGLVELCLVADELGRAAAPGPFIESALTALTLSRTGHKADADLLAGLVNGTARATWAHAGTLRATHDGDSTRITGRVTAMHAAASDAVVVRVTGGSGCALFLLPSREVHLIPRRTLDETRRWYDAEVDVVRLDPDVITTDAEEIERLFGAAAILTAADALGVGRRLLDLTVEHAKVREQFGRPLGSFQSVKHKVADMLTLIKALEAQVYGAAMLWDAGHPDWASAASAAKAYANTEIPLLAGEALQTHGGIGFTWEHDLHLYLRRAKANTVVHGTTRHHQDRLVALLEA